MTRQEWTSAEEAALATLAILGARQVAEILDRPVDCVKRKASRMQVSLRKKSEINVTTLSPAAIERVKKTSPAMLCPSCGKRLVVPKLGSCGACHYEALKEAHDEAYAELVAKREYNTSKQRLSRKRRELGVPAPGGRASGGGTTLCQSR